MEENKTEVVVNAEVANTNQENKPATNDARPQRGDRNNRRPRRNTRGRRDEGPKEFDERVVFINRVSKTVKGGRHMRFSALVVIGDGKGRFGFGTGKSGEVPDAIKKALDNARKNVTKVQICKSGTIAHEVMGKFGACQVFLKPAPEGTGIIAGGPVRAILELAGLKNVYSKVYGSRNSINIIRATHQGITSIKSYSKVKALRNPVETVEE